MPTYAPSTQIQTQPEFDGILREDLGFSTGADTMEDRVNGWFDRLLLQSGLRMHPGVFILLCMTVGAVFAGVFTLVSGRLIPTVFMALCGMVLPIVWAVILRTQRQRTMLKQMPGMVEELARAARTGRSLEHCLQTVALDTPEPLGPELMESVRRNQMGLDLAAAIEDLPVRTGVVSMNVFTTALSVHQDTGGDLVNVLERLSQAVRDRLMFISRLQAATAANRVTVLLMVVILPALIFAFFLYRDPAYFDRIFASGLARGSFWMAIILELIGATVAYVILRRSRRT